MKYYFKKSTVSHPHRDRELRKYRYAGRDKPKMSYPPLIDLSVLFSVPLLAPPQKKKRKKTFIFGSRLKRAFVSVKAKYLALTAKVKDVFAKWREKRAKRGERQDSTAMLGGMLCSAVFVSLCSLLLVAVPFFLRYNRIYTAVIVPDFTSLTYDEILDYNDERFDFVIELCENDSAGSGDIISQTPKAGVERRIYVGDSGITVNLTVCSPDVAFKLEELSGTPKRDSALLLRNRGLLVEITEQYSSQVPAGTVISTYPKAGETLKKGDKVTLTVSVGEEMLYASMPNLCGLSESEAISRIISLGFEVGEIKYASSSSSAGTVTEQSVAPYTSLELGASVSITVSSGDSHTQRLVPDLYGLTLDEAVSRLGECGLVLGNVYYIGSTAPDDISARVVSQSPESGSAISSSVTSVDVYLS